jgi:hypothetical protein
LEVKPPIQSFSQSSEFLMSFQQANRLSIIIRYVLVALLISLPGVLFSAKAVAMYRFQQRHLHLGFIVYDVPENPGMPIDAYIRWMLVFSVPPFVVSAFVLYRLFIRISCEKNRTSQH